MCSVSKPEDLFCLFCRELAQERTRWSQKEAKMRAEYTALEEMVKLVRLELNTSAFQKEDHLYIIAPCRNHDYLVSK